MARGGYLCAAPLRAAILDRLLAADLADRRSSPESGHCRTVAAAPRPHRLDKGRVESRVEGVVTGRRQSELHHPAEAGKQDSKYGHR